MRKNRFSAKRIAILGLLLALALILSYVEALIPFNIGIPGVKLGLANTANVFILYFIGAPEAIIIGILRVLLSGLLFGNLYSIIFSLGGAFLSLAGMLLLKKFSKLSLISVSATAGVLHNIGQYIIACITVENYRILYYLPVLVISGLITGCIIGIIGSILVDRIPRELIFSSATTNTYNPSFQPVRRFLRFDSIYLSLVFVISILFTVLIYNLGKNGEKILISIDNVIIEEYSLSEDRQITLETGNTITIQDGHVFMSDAICPDKLCMHQGKKSKNNECIVCLPNKVVVTVVSDEESELDSINR